MSQLGAEPTHRDIFVEIDRMEDIGWFPSSVKRELQRVYQNAPIENPDGTTGVRLHLVEDDVVPSVTEFNSDEFAEDKFSEYIENYKSYGKGFYYCLLLGNSAGYGARAFVGEGFYFYPSTGLDNRYSEISFTFMHELGHCLGLSPSVFSGIDSTKYDFSTYRSVMNYASPADFCDYSSGAPFNDWEYLENEGFFLPSFREDSGVENIKIEK